MGVSTDIRDSMDTHEVFSLRWNDYNKNINQTYQRLLQSKNFADVTLVCSDGKRIEAHKVILSGSGSFFSDILTNSDHPHPLIYMKGVSVNDLKSIIDFIYNGEVNIAQNNLDTFLALAEELQLTGLMKDPRYSEKEEIPHETMLEIGDVKTDVDNLEY